MIDHAIDCLATSSVLSKLNIKLYNLTTSKWLYKQNHHRWLTDLRRPALQLDRNGSICLVGNLKLFMMACLAMTREALLRAWTECLQERNSPVVPRSRSFLVRYRVFSSNAAASTKNIEYLCQTLRVACQRPSLLLVNPSMSVTSPKVDDPGIVVLVDQDILGLCIAPDDVLIV